MQMSRTSHLHLVFILAFVAAAFGLRGQSFYRNYTPDGSYCLDFVETADSGFLLIGGIGPDSTLFLQRTNANGIVQWTNHQYLNGARGVAVCRAADGGFAVLCNRFDDGIMQRSIVLKIDSAGATEWQRVLAYPTLSNGFVDIAATADGGFAVLGNARTLTPVLDFHLRLLRLDADGNELWSQTLGSTSDGKEIPRTLAVLPNGDIVVAGERREAASVLGDSDFFLARTNAQGDILWQQEYNKPGYQTALDFKVDQNGNYVLLGESKQATPYSMTILKTNGDGVEIWYKHPLVLDNADGTVPLRKATCLALDPAGNLYLPYQTVETIGPHNPTYFLKLDAAGDSVWTRGPVAHDRLANGAFTADHHFVFAGQTDPTVGDFTQAVLLKTDWSGSASLFFSTLSGSVFWDQNLDCATDGAEPAPPVFIVKAENQFGDIWYRYTNSAGQYSLLVTTGNYTITARPLPGLEALWQICDTPFVQVPVVDTSIQAPPLGVQSIADCPYLEIELSAGLLRRCTTANYFVQYCNHGTQTATDASVQVALHPLTSYTNSSIPLAGQSGDTLFFDIGNVAPGVCDFFSFQVMVSCAAGNGQTLCAAAHIFPDTTCLPPDPQWDGSDVQVEAACNGTATFTIRNIGAGDMTGPVEYVIIEDQIMYMSGNVQLDAGADSVISVANPANVSYYLTAGQRPGHPGLGNPAAVTDGCNIQHGASLALQFQLDGANPHLDIYCNEIVGSYDPNDKQGYPLGWHDEHYLETGQEIEYKIRFQNTGNDTAFLVVIRDTLPATLDPATVRPGVASHPYGVQMSGANVLVFSFPNILLPDSTTNEAESHGFVTFRVAQQPDLPLGTRIENRAAIYFDFNDPVITEPYFHTIGRPLLSVSTDAPTPNALDLLVFPNPMSDYADFRISGENTGERYRFRLFSPTGQTLREQFFVGETHRFYRNDLAPGLYFFRLENAAGRAATGRVIVGK